MQNFPSDVLDTIRVHLEEQKTRVAARIHELGAQDPFADPERLNDNAASDMEASEESNHDRVAAVMDELKAQIVDIDAALARVADGTYGFCNHCRQMIDTDRLGILPTAILCLSCEQEKKK